MKKQHMEYFVTMILVALFIGISLGRNGGIMTRFQPEKITPVTATLKEKEMDYQEQQILKQANQESTDQESANKESTNQNSTNSSDINTDDIVPEIPAEELGEEKNEGQETDDNVQPELNVGFVIGADGMLEHFYDGDSSVDDGYLELPSNGCIGIRGGAFESYSGCIMEIYVPANITQMERGAFAGLNDLEWLEIDSRNGSIISIDGAVFGTGGQELIAFPSARTGNYAMPKTVTTVWSQAFYNTKLKQLDLLNMDYVTFEENAFGPNQSEGLTIRVPTQYAEQYQTALSTYAVRIESVGS